MYRIRFHGRGGQGMKTASRILGSAFFAAGFEVQDAPRYGAERRGAPIFAYVRAATQRINERGIITYPDLIVVADETLIPMPSVNVTQGSHRQTIMVILSEKKTSVWKERLNFTGEIVTLPPTLFDRPTEQHHFTGIISTSLAAAMINDLGWKDLEQGIKTELQSFSHDIIKKNLNYAEQAYLSVPAHPNVVESQNLPAIENTTEKWINLEFSPARTSAPAIHAARTSVEVRTGFWRTQKPLIDPSRCHKCSWICSTFCPDGAITVEQDRSPKIDYDHCKGCMVCLVQCPHHAISAQPEQTIGSKDKKGAPL